MQIAEITKHLNRALSGELISLQEMSPYINDAIDYINGQLNSTYPALSDLPALGGAVDYNFFPDRYIRTVVIPYAAWRFYVTDDEGNAAAPQYQADALSGMFYMQRDMLYNIPLEYQADVNQGSIEFVADTEQGVRGLEMYGNDFVL